MKHGKFKSRKTMKQATRRHSRLYIPSKGTRRAGFALDPFGMALENPSIARHEPADKGMIANIAAVAMSMFKRKRGRS